MVTGMCQYMVQYQTTTYSNKQQQEYNGDQPAQWSLRSGLSIWYDMHARLRCDQSRLRSILFGHERSLARLRQHTWFACHLITRRGNGLAESGIESSCRCITLFRLFSQRLADCTVDLRRNIHA